MPSSCHMTCTLGFGGAISPSTKVSAALELDDDAAAAATEEELDDAALTKGFVMVLAFLAAGVSLAIALGRPALAFGFFTAGTGTSSKMNVVAFLIETSVMPGHKWKNTVGKLNIESITEYWRTAIFHFAIWTNGFFSKPNKVSLNG